MTEFIKPSGILAWFFEQEEETLTPITWLEWSSNYFGTYGYITLGTILAIVDSVIFIAIISKRLLRCIDV
ncbi:unnamed protein product [Gongylonema pulchrum]|uniref:Uncharacterized protein n=1 Tax=Gongylonema pulchrum TaxID=637853 RepID=A0A183D5X8_9BILA|nr:unnamed protein product [Gongylonema pulchrum]VDK62910.1 unnamed protein product [Gongylonema pulchrum]